MYLPIRQQSLSAGVEIDDEANKLRGEEVKISTENSKVPVYVVPTNEELAIARETVALAK